MKACCKDPATRQQTLLYRGAAFGLGEFRCPPADERWRTENIVGRWPLAAFAATSVVIRQARSDPVLANANHAVLYRAGERYHRILHDPRGDHCIFVALEPEFAARLLKSVGVAGTEFPVVLGPTRPRSYLGLRLAALAARSGAANRLAVEEAVCLIVSSAVEDGVAIEGMHHGTRKATVRQHRQLIERAKQLLTERADANDSLSSIAGSLHTSEFHLARIFRARTGFTLHAYRTQLRLRAALDPLGSAGTDLRTLGIELGFNSHSHFTGSFTASFGLPPSKIREVNGRRGLRELSRILEARLADAS